MPGIKGHPFRWGKHDVPAANDSFVLKFSDTSQPELTPLPHLKMFFTEEANAQITEQTNSFSVKKTCKSIEGRLSVGNTLNSLSRMPTYTQQVTRKEKKERL